MTTEHDTRASLVLPAGYFTETLALNKRLHSYKSESRAGTLDGGYATMPFCVGLREPTVEQVTWHDWYDAVLWCRDDARQRQARKQLITYGMLGAMVRHWKEGEAG